VSRLTAAGGAGAAALSGLDEYESHLGRWPIYSAARGLEYAIRHFATTQPDISQALQAVLDDINAETKLAGMRFDEGDGPCV
jgi:hypothetical protein